MTEEKPSEDTIESPSGLRIRDLRIERGMSQEELADALGCRQEAVSAIERKGPKTLRTTVKVAAALDVSPSYIAFGEHSAESLIAAMPDLAERLEAELKRIETDGIG